MTQTVSPVIAQTALDIINDYRAGYSTGQAALGQLLALVDDTPNITPDIAVENHGSLFLLQPLTALGRDAITHVLDVNHEAQTFCGALVVEPRYVGPLLDTLADEFGVTYDEP